MADSNVQLKRKREGSEAHQKKTKKPKKIEEQSPVTPAATPKSKHKAKPTSQASPESLEPENASTVTPSKKRKNKKNHRKQQEEQVQKGKDAAQVEGRNSSAGAAKESTPRKSKAQTKYEAIQNGTAKDNHNGVQEEAPSGTSTSPAMPIRQPEKEKKKKEKKKKNLEEGKGSKQLVKATKADLSMTQASTSSEKKTSASKPVKKWTISPVQGGWFLPKDPVFSLDEKHLFLANDKSLQIYATDTSTLTNTLLLERGGLLTSFALSYTKPNLVYIADSRGYITLWNWTNGSKMEYWEIGTAVSSMQVVLRPETDEDLIYCHQSSPDNVISVHTFGKKSQGSTTEGKTVIETDSPVRGVQVLLQGKYIVLNCKESIIVAKRSRLSNTSLQDFEYVWRELRFSNRITTCSAFLRKPEEAASGKKSAQSARDVLDIAVGDRTGVILLFEDILPTFAAIEGNQKSNKNKVDNAENFRPKKLHWHREAVGAIKWSLDGNYLISGGDETVLTIWQLATGKLQHLPHLTAAIENITISPFGSAYGVTLANNSVIVLSTTELEAKTNIIGIQSRRVDFEYLSSRSKSIDEYSGLFSHVPMAINPRSPDELIFSVPSSQSRSKNKNLPPEPYLQTFDLANYRAKSRQALTRNNATDINVAPEGGRVIEPSVKLLQVSHDGQWLATVDEWIPPRTDATYLDEGIPEFNEENRLQRREVHLKIWRQDVEQGQWKLDTRIDAPHFFENECANGIVFDLVADPAAAGFATVGEDHVVRIWRPKTRLRDGLVVRGVQDEGLVTWCLSRAIEISDKFDVDENSGQSLTPHASRLAFSGDGSVLAAAISWAPESGAGMIHLIDPDTATINRSISEIDITALAGLGVKNRHLIVVGDSITVWDMVLDQLVYCIPLPMFKSDQFERAPLVRFAVNEMDNTFAIATSQSQWKKTSFFKSAKFFSMISVFDVDQQKPLDSSTDSSVTLALVSRRGDRGYVVLDSRSCVRTISPYGGSVQLPTPPPESKTELQLADNSELDIEEDEPAEPVLKSLLSEDLSQDLDDDKPVLNQQSLQDVLENGAVSLPPQGLFNTILALVGRAPKTAV